MQLHQFLTVGLCALAPSVAGLPSRRATNSSLPTVDLGYQVQQASGYNVGFIQ